jgi:hypothetical protein
MSLIQRIDLLLADWRIMRYERRLDRLGAELEHMRQLRDFAAREAGRLQRELIETWREAEEVCRD